MVVVSELKKYRPVTFTLAIFNLAKDHNRNRDFGSHFCILDSLDGHFVALNPTNPLLFLKDRWRERGERESLTGWALQQSVHSKPKTHCHLQSGCAKERASDKTEKITVIYNASYVGRYLGLKPEENR